MSDVAVETETPKRSRRWLVLGGLAVVLALAAGWWLFGTADAAEDADAADGEIVALPSMTTTVGEQGLAHARVGLAVVLDEDADPAVVEPRQALLQDALLQHISSLDADSVRSAEGSEQLRKALSERAREIWGEDVVRRVVMTELMVQ